MPDDRAAPHADATPSVKADKAGALTSQSQPWLKNYQTNTDWAMPLEPQPLYELIHATAQKIPDNTAIDFLGKTMTYRELEQAVLEVAAGLQGRGLKKGDRVGLLLPNTPETENTLDAAALGLMPQGAVILNPGRGPLIDDDALLESLNIGHIGHATLDVFRQEPLPPEHPFWSHPRITVTPHIAAETRAASTATVIAENIRRNEAGEPMRFLVDRDLQY